jgi:hypothetical protein
VHSALLHDGRRVVMKVQYPGVARSIESDVDNLMRLVSLANILPRGLYVENAVSVAKRELRLECDYRYELQSQQRFKALVAADAYAAQVGPPTAAGPSRGAGLASLPKACQRAALPGLHHRPHCSLPAPLPA